MKFNGEGDVVEWLEEVDRFVQMFQWKGMDVYEFMVLNMTGVAKDFALHGMKVDEGITKEQLFENVEKRFRWVNNGEEEEEEEGIEGLEANREICRL